MRFRCQPNNILVLSNRVLMKAADTSHQFLGKKENLTLSKISAEVGATLRPFDALAHHYLCQRKVFVHNFFWVNSNLINQKY